MENQNIKVRATLIKASRNDVFNNDGSLKENKLLFCRDMKRNHFRGTYKIPRNEQYWITEVNMLLESDFLYTLTSEHNENDFCFHLILRPGNWFDFFDSAKWVKPNVVYYVLTADDMVTGPHIMKEETDIAYLGTAVAAGKLYVPGKQQYEPYRIRKAA